MEIDYLDERIRIRDEIKSGRIKEDNDLVNKINNELMENDSYI
jgi:hypothetical protein